MLMSALKPLGELENAAEFVARHIGIEDSDERHMLSVIGSASRRALIDAIVPRAIARPTAMALPAPLTEARALADLKRIAGKNRVLKSFIGQGYHGTLTPGVILRNVLENPAWYTAYTPYQAEISQGRMEALVNFQTMVCDLTGLAIAGSSMLDEATAAAEAMTLAMRVGKSKSTVFFVADDVLPQTLEVVQTRAKPLGITVATGPADQAGAAGAFGALFQYPGVTVNFSGAARVRTTSSVCGSTSSATNKLVLLLRPTRAASVMASAAAVASSSIDALEIAMPVRSLTIVWKLTRASMRPCEISAW